MFSHDVFYIFIFIILGIIGALSFIPLWSVEKGYHSEINMLGIFYSLTSFISGFFTQGICLGIATIAEGALIKSIAREREIEAKEKAEKELGFRYKYSLEEGLQKLIDWRIETGLDKRK